MTLLVDRSISFTCRNTGSIQALKKYVHQKLHYKIQLQQCPAINLNEKFKFKHQDSKIVAFVLGGDRLNLRHQDLVHYIVQINNFINYLRFNEYKVVLVNHLNDNWIGNYCKFDYTFDLYGKPAVETFAFY